ncbi:protein phosphatase methylesterase 1 [Puccinia sorghi]|uniref:Protein phosphatase methylesterase 1 n=1 Tax=Puccinia sorghi TaxID=27349 RepID=A0A0L6VLV3_9BASI|nr:protein phosphatase methylesterase 1 [Puccinia sorghi]
MTSSQPSYEPLSAAADSFRHSHFLTLNPAKRFRVYSNPPNPVCNDPVVFVFHHGAGYSGLSAACLARELREQTQGQYGFISFDCRFHGATQVDTANPAMPDLSLSTLAGDLVELLGALYPNQSKAPSLVLIGHSMGAAVVTEACAAIQLNLAKVLGLVLPSAPPLSASNTSPFLSRLFLPLCDPSPPSDVVTSIRGCIQSVDSHTIRNLQSARISVPSLIRNVSHPSSSHPTRSSLPAVVAEEEEEEGSSAEPRFESKPISTSHPAEDAGEEEKEGGSRFEWITDLRQSQPHWEGWFRGLSGKFLVQKTARLLVLAGTDRLDKELMIGQMQGKKIADVMTLSTNRRKVAERLMGWVWGWVQASTSWWSCPTSAIVYTKMTPLLSPTSFKHSSVVTTPPTALPSSPVSERPLSRKSNPQHLLPSPSSSLPLRVDYLPPPINLSTSR